MGSFKNETWYKFKHRFHMGFFDKIKSALTKTSSNLSKIGDIFTKKGVTAESLEDFEEILLAADFGIETTNFILDKIKSIKFSKEEGIEEFKAALSKIIEEMLLPAEQKIEIKDGKLNILFFCGVNGNGKTTTIGKLANLYKKQGKKVVVAACDTFRSAAVDQLRIWCERAGCNMIEGEKEADPASVAFKAIENAKTSSADILIIDTAGRLQNHSNLMDELSKILKVIKKADPAAPHYTILTLDASTGQNAFGQVEKFKEIAGITGVIFTKLDGTAKGGTIVGITNKHKLPIYYISVGEQIEDLAEFDAKIFASSLLA